MKTRESLDDTLRAILGTGNVYFQPPEGTKIKYPCIIYERSDYYDRHADNIKYQIHRRYTIKVIYRDPDCKIPDKIHELPMCGFDRSYIADNLYHDVFNIYW